MNRSVFDFIDYKSYLAVRLPTTGAERGNRARLAAHLKCQPAFVTQVLTGKPHFSLEHAVLIDDFLQHTADEGRFFLLLVHHGRAGTGPLRNHYALQLETLRAKHKKIGERVKPEQSLTQENMHRYYSNWIPSAIHVLVMVPGKWTPKSIADRLRLPVASVTETIDFLLQVGIVAENADGSLAATGRRMHLKNDNSMIHKHNSNWRIRALNALDVDDPINLHYSGPIALSRANAELLRNWMLHLIERLEPVLAEPNEEELFALTMDLFRV